MTLQIQTCGRTAVLAIAASFWLLLGTGDAAQVQVMSSPVPHRLSGRPAGKPAYLWLWYADGSASPQGGPVCSGLKPPAFTPANGATLGDWQRQVQAYLDLWYADFNLVFTLTQPPTSDYYTMIITNDGSWCQQTPIEGGIAWSTTCADVPGEIAYALQCGSSAHGCATIIAHEHGHMVGLQHTKSTTDVMNATILVTAAGFDNRSDPIDLSNPADTSNTTFALNCDPQQSLYQNSYQLMLSRLGSWQGGNKPSLFSKLPDAGADAADAATSSFLDAAQVGSPIGDPLPLTDGDGGVTVLSGFDALTRPPLPTVDAPPASPASQHGGCSMVHAGEGKLPCTGLLALALVLATRLRRSASAARDRTDRPARRS
jgi:hypothetical protein